MFRDQQIELPVMPIPVPGSEALLARFVLPVVDTSKPLMRFPIPQSAAGSESHASAIILLIEKLADGSVGDITVKMSAGNQGVDAAAIAYVRALPRKAGLIGGKAVSMKVLYSMNL